MDANAHAQAARKVFETGAKVIVRDTDTILDGMKGTVTSVYFINGFETGVHVVLDGEPGLWWFFSDELWVLA